MYALIRLIIHHQNPKAKFPCIGATKSFVTVTIKKGMSL